jgi:hypothetical protein
MWEVGWTAVDDEGHALVRGRETKGGLRDDLDTRSPLNSTPTTMDELGHPESRPSLSDAEDDEGAEMVSLEEIAMTPQKATHATDNDSESSDDDEDAGRGLLVSGSRRRPGHAHTRSLSLSRGIDIWQQVKNIVIEVSGHPSAAREKPYIRIDCTYALVHNIGYHVHRRVDGERPCEHPSRL